MPPDGDHDRIVRDFFTRYVRRFNDALDDSRKVDVAAIRDLFADYFVGANPNGVRGGRNGFLFRLMLPRGYRAYRKMGMRAMEIAGIEVTTLDAFHAMARVNWLARFDASKGVDDFVFTNIYVLQIRNGDAKVFAYITPDEQAELKARGLIK